MSSFTHLMFWTGSNAELVKVCGREERLNNCTDEACNKLCVDKYGGASQKASGFCKPPSSCGCTFLCPPGGA